MRVSFEEFFLLGNHMLPLKEVSVLPNWRFFGQSEVLQKLVIRRNLAVF